LIIFVYAYHSVASGLHQHQLCNQKQLPGHIWKLGMWPCLLEVFIYSLELRSILII